MKKNNLRYKALKRCAQVNENVAIDLLKLKRSGVNVKNFIDQVENIEAPYSIVENYNFMSLDDVDVKDIKESLMELGASRKLLSEAVVLYNNEDDPNQYTLVDDIDADENNIVNTTWREPERQREKYEKKIRMVINQWAYSLIKAALIDFNNPRNYVNKDSVNDWDEEQNIEVARELRKSLSIDDIIWSIEYNKSSAINKLRKSIEYNYTDENGNWAKILYKEFDFIIKKVKEKAIDISNNIFEDPRISPEVLEDIDMPPGKYFQRYISRFCEFFNLRDLRLRHKGYYFDKYNESKSFKYTRRNKMNEAKKEIDPKADPKKSTFHNSRDLTSVTIPDSVTEIEDYAFYNSRDLTSVTIPNSVRKIGRYAFAGCRKLKSVIIPNSVVYIDDYAFYRCDNLVSITIPSSVEIIGSDAFYGCRKLDTVYVEDIEKFNQIRFKDTESDPTCYGAEINRRSADSRNRRFIQESKKRRFIQESKKELDPKADLKKRQAELDKIVEEIKNDTNLDKKSAKKYTTRLKKIKDLKNLKKAKSIIKKLSKVYPEAADILTESLVLKVVEAAKNQRGVLNENLRINNFHISSYSLKELKECYNKVEKNVKALNSKIRRSSLNESCTAADIRKLKEDLKKQTTLLGKLDEEISWKMLILSKGGLDKISSLLEGEDTKEEKKADDAASDSLDDLFNNIGNEMEDNIEDAEGDKDTKKEEKDTEDDDVELDSITITMKSEDAANALKDSLVEKGVPEDAIEVEAVEDEDEAKNESMKYSNKFMRLFEDEEISESDDEDTEESSDNSAEESSDESNDDSEDKSYNVTLTDTDYVNSLKDVMVDEYGYTEDEFWDSIGGKPVEDDEDEKSDEDKEDDNEKKDDEDDTSELDSIGADIFGDQ